MQDITYCPNHPRTPSKLSCGRCGELVCPLCMIHSPVGIRCLDCGQGVRLPIYVVSRTQLARGIAVSLLTGLAAGLAAGLIVRGILPIILYLIAMAGFGYMLGKIISLSAGQKRGMALQLIAVGGTLAAYLTIALITFYLHRHIDLFDMIGVGIAAYIAFLYLR